MVKRPALVLLGALLTLISCKPKPKPKVVEPPKKTFPAITWKRTVSSNIIIAAESRKRIFGVEFDDKSNPISVNAYNKSSGRRKWTKEVELGLLDSSNKHSFNVKLKGAAVALWAKSNQIYAVDRYRGVDLWDKPVSGMGLGLLGENFITAFDTKVRLIDPESGKSTDFEVGRKITQPLHVTPKGYIVVVTGDTAQLIDLEGDKVTVRWKWLIDMDKGFEAGQVISSDDAVIFFQKTHEQENQLWFKNFSGETMKQTWKLKFKGSESKPQTFRRFETGSLARFVYNPESSVEKQWRMIDLSTGKLMGTPVYSKIDPPRHCLIDEKLSYCANDKGITAYETSTWKKKWFQETILPVQDNEHKIIDGNLVLAAVNRIKIFAPNGSSPLAMDLKSPTIKEPRVNKILGGKEGIIFFTVADLSNPAKSRGEVWALDMRKKRILWRVNVGGSRTIIEAVKYLPELDKIIAATNTKIIAINTLTGYPFTRFHKIRTDKKEKVSVGNVGDMGYAVLPSAVQFFKISKNRFALKTKFTLEKKEKAKKGAKPEVKKFSFVGTGHGQVLIKDMSGNNEITAYDLETGKNLYTTTFASILEPQLAVTTSLFVLHSIGAAKAINPKDGKSVKEFTSVRRLFAMGDTITVISQVLSKPAYGSRLYAFTYENTTGKAPKLSWKRDFKIGKDKPLKGFDEKAPKWVSTGTEYVFHPAKGGRCLMILSSADGEKVLELCKSVWPWPPLVYKGKYYHASGTLVDGVPKGQQGLVRFTLDGKFKQLLKLGKYGDPKYFNHQIQPIKRGTLYLLGNGEVLQAVQVSE